MSSIDTSGTEDFCLSSCDPVNMLDLSDADNRDTFEKLLGDVKQDHHLRRAAARRLGDIGNLKSTKALCVALEDTYPSIRFEAITALGKIGGKHAYEALSNLLECDSLYVRGMAARALIQISGVPDSKEENLEKLMKLICSGDKQIKKAVLDIGPPSIDLLMTRLQSSSFTERQEVATTIALHIRELIDQLPPGETVFSWLKGLGISAKSIADLYSFRIVRIDENTDEENVDKVENSGFDAVSKTLCGDRLILRLLSGTFDLHEPEITTINLKDLIPDRGFDEVEKVGRTLVVPLGSACLAIKLCMNEGDAALLSAEAKMQRMLATFELSSRLPRPLGGLFRLQGLPLYVQDLKLSEAYAICYIADCNYFRYLGDPAISIEETKAALLSCAGDLGRLTRSGIIHTSLIPLFHNRERHIGDSAYRWNRKVAGRLDNWLESCMYPNMRLSGIADLEHIEIHPEIPAWVLQSYVGEHLLSISLVLGSYFCRRERFDENALGSILMCCFLKYCCSMGGSSDMVSECLSECIDWMELAGRMAEEMGSHATCETETGQTKTSQAEANGAKTIHHLGRSNGPFPVPELIRAIHITSLFAVLELQARNWG